MEMPAWFYFATVLMAAVSGFCIGYDVGFDRALKVIHKRLIEKVEK